MTISEYANLEEQCKSETLNKCIDVDKQFSGQCWDLNQYYNIKYLGVPAYVLGGCGYVSQMLKEPKLNDLLTYFDEVPIDAMIKGDTVIWDWNGWDKCHIAVFDNWDGQYCWFLTQNNPVENLTTLSILDTAYARAFRLKGITPDPEPPKPEPTDFKIGDYVVPTKLFDYAGTPLVQYDDLYQIIDKDERGNVLGAVRGDERPVWAVLPNSNIMKVD